MGLSQILSRFIPRRPEEPVLDGQDTQHCLFTAPSTACLRRCDKSQDIVLSSHCFPQPEIQDTPSATGAVARPRLETKFGDCRGASVQARPVPDYSICPKMDVMLGYGTSCQARFLSNC